MLEDLSMDDFGL